MAYKLIAIDLDDSLLGNDLTISHKNKEAITRAVNAGVTVTIATGRMYKSALPYVKQLKLDVPVITYQGAMVRSALSHEILYHCPVPYDIAMDIIKESNRMGTHIQVYIDDKYYFEKENNYSKLYAKNAGIPGMPVGPLDKFLKKPPTKLLIIDEPHRVMELRSKYQEILQGKVQITISKPNFLEFTNLDATKGKAVGYLADRLGIKKEEIIAIGDSYNDISMIEFAGLGVAMGNAPEPVKKCADFITFSNNEEGVAHVIDKFVLKGGGSY